MFREAMHMFRQIYIKVYIISRNWSNNRNANERHIMMISKNASEKVHDGHDFNASESGDYMIEIAQDVE